MSLTQHGFVHTFVPAQRDKLPTLLLLHGTGGDENDLIPLAQSILPGAALLGVRGKVSEHGAARFFRRLSEGVFDEQDLLFRTLELKDFVMAATIEYALDADQLYAIGFSNGANIAASTMLLCPGVLAGGILLRAMMPLEPSSQPSLTGTRVLLGAGSQDPIVSRTSVERLQETLRLAGADVTMHWSQAGHGLVPSDIVAAQQWMHRQS